MSTVKDAMRNVILGIRNLFRYFNIIWNDRDWDYYYLLKLISKKLYYMELEHINDKIHADHMKYAGTIKDTRECLDRLIDDSYLESEWDEYFTKYPINFDDLNSRTKEQTEELLALEWRESMLRKNDEDEFARSFKWYYKTWWT